MGKNNITGKVFVQSIEKIHQIDQPIVNSDSKIRISRLKWIKNWLYSRNRVENIDSSLLGHWSGFWYDSDLSSVIWISYSKNCRKERD